MSSSVARVAAVATSAVGVLAEPVTFPNGKQARNRFMKSPLTEKLFDWTDPQKLGLPSRAMKNIYSKWGHGGFGLIVTGSFAVDPKYISEAGQGIISRETFSSNLDVRRDLKELSSALKSDGALAVAQLRHSGVGAIREYTSADGQKHVVNEHLDNPLAFPARRLQEDIVERYVFAASVLYGSGFDGVELLTAFGSVFSQMLSPKKNERKDEYGGSVENRARLLLETFQAIRRAVPAGFLIGVKLNSRDFQEFGMPREEVIRLCELIEEAGFDFIELSGGMMEMTMKDAITRDSTASRENYFFDFIQFTSSIFKKTQTYITGGWQTANSMVTSVEMGLTRGIGAARWSCVEPDFPKKLLAGEIDSIPAMRFPPFDFWYMKNAALWHIRQLSETAFDEQKGPSYGITDFTVQEEAANFQKACDAFKIHVDTLGTIDNRPGTIDYKPLNN